MGESFKLHSQALIGYEDEIIQDPVNGMDPMGAHSLMGVEAAY